MLTAKIKTIIGQHNTFSDKYTYTFEYILKAWNKNVQQFVFKLTRWAQVMWKAL